MDEAEGNGDYSCMLQESIYPLNNVERNEDRDDSEYVVGEEENDDNSEEGSDLEFFYGWR